MQELYHLPLFEGKGLRHSLMPINRQSSLPTLSYRVGLITYEENLMDVDNSYIIPQDFPISDSRYYYKKEIVHLTCGGVDDLCM